DQSLEVRYQAFEEVILVVHCGNGLSNEVVERLGDLRLCLSKSIRGSDIQLAKVGFLLAPGGFLGSEPCLDGSAMLEKAPGLVHSQSGTGIAHRLDQRLEAPPIHVLTAKISFCIEESSSEVVRPEIEKFGVLLMTPSRVSRRRTMGEASAASGPTMIHVDTPSRLRSLSQLVHTEEQLEVGVSRDATNHRSCGQCSPPTAWPRSPTDSCGSLGGPRGQWPTDPEPYAATRTVNSDVWFRPGRASRAATLVRFDRCRSIGRA